MTLTGNLAPQGVLLNLDVLPEDMAFVRCAPLLFSSPREALTALESGTVPQDTAVFILGGQDGCGGNGPRVSGADLARAADEGGSGHLVFVTDGCLDGCVPEAANIVYPSLGEALRCGAGMVRPTDKFEYDVFHGRINLDLSESFDDRMEPAAPAAGDGTDLHFTVRKLGDGLWSIMERYSRMFLIAGAERALLFDTGFGEKDPGKLISSLTRLPYDVVLSHGHWDHTGGLDYFQEAWIRPEDIPLLDEKKRGRLRQLEDGMQFELGGRRIEAIHCPGHTRGCISLLDRGNRMVFSGDSIFEGPVYLFQQGSSPEAFLASMRRMDAISTLFDAVYPCHKKLPLKPSCFAEAKQCMEDALSGAVQGIPARVSPCDRGLKTYFNGQVGVFL